MLSPALLIAIYLTVYLLVIAAFCQRKLHGVVWWRRLLSLLFPTSQLCLVLFALGAAAAYAAPSAPVAVIAVVGIACGLSICCCSRVCAMHAFARKPPSRCANWRMS